MGDGRDGSEHGRLDGEGTITRGSYSRSYRIQCIESTLVGIMLDRIKTYPDKCYTMIYLPQPCTGPRQRDRATLALSDCPSTHPGASKNVNAGTLLRLWDPDWVHASNIGSAVGCSRGDGAHRMGVEALHRIDLARRGNDAFLCGACERCWSERQPCSRAVEGVCAVRRRHSSAADGLRAAGGAGSSGTRRDGGGDRCLEHFKGHVRRSAMLIFRPRGKPNDGPDSGRLVGSNDGRANRVLESCRSSSSSSVSPPSESSS